jgi:glycosyltransferase 2 family protein
LFQKTFKNRLPSFHQQVSSPGLKARGNGFVHVTILSWFDERLPRRITEPCRSSITLEGASNVLSAIASAARKRIGWSSLTGAASLAIVAVSAVALYELLHGIDARSFIAALRAQPPHALLLASGFVAASYFMLTCYDVFALRAIGRQAIPYRAAALASFTSYTIGHNFGATIFAAGVIRYRVYAFWGLRIRDITAIAVITSLTYWLGNALVLGFGLLSAPQAVSALDRLPAPANRLIGLALLMGLAGYFLWLLPGPRHIGRANWQIAIPGPRPMLVQISIACLDLVCVGLAMYMLLPPHPAIDFLRLLTITAAALLIGVVSHAPASLGVMEAAMFLGLPQFKKEELLACLLTFRLLYFVLPFVVAALLLGLREFGKVFAGIRARKRLLPLFHVLRWIMGRPRAEKARGLVRAQADLARRGHRRAGEETLYGDR